MLLAKTLKSSTYKLALISIGIFGAVVLALFGYVYWATISFVHARTDHAITGDLLALREAYDQAGRSGLAAGIERRLVEERYGGGVYLLTDPSYERVAGNLKSWPAPLKGAEGWNSFAAPAPNAGSSEQVFIRARFERLPDGYHLLVGKDVGELNGFINAIKTALMLSILLICMLAGVASVFVTRRTVGRIEAINATSQAIMQSGLGKRIPLRGTRDEWDQLADNLNSMLDRIELLVGEVKQATDNVAHDLRTPLSRMYGSLEKASTRRRDRDQDQMLIADTMSNLDGVLRMFSSLTRISQIEADDRRAALPTVNLFDIAADVADLFGAASEEKSGQLSVTGDRQSLISGDRDLLFDALSNLVDNAIKHGRQGGHVTIDVARVESCVVLAVSDDGAGIPADERPHVFKRFYRLERSRHTLGNGLGLSLVAAVARFHAASIAMLDNAPGLRCELRFPAMFSARPDIIRP